MIYALPAGSRIPYVYIIAWIWGYVKFWDTKRGRVGVCNLKILIHGFEKIIS